MNKNGNYQYLLQSIKKIYQKQFNSMVGFILSSNYAVKNVFLQSELRQSVRKVKLIINSFLSQKLVFRIEYFNRYTKSITFPLFSIFRNSVVNFVSSQIPFQQIIPDSQKTMKRFQQASEISKLYNNDIAPEDSQKTSFYYHKTLVQSYMIQALQCIIAICSVLVIISAITFKFYSTFIHQVIIKDLILTFTLLHIASLALQTLSRIKWMQEKKNLQQKGLKQYFLWGIQTILLVPIPNRWVIGKIQIDNELLSDMNIDDLLTLYILIRIVYVIKFLIHSELFYGSRPDRLSRLYTVKFGTFNALKFLINQKAYLVIITASLINFIYLPIALLILQGGVNQNLNNFLACVHFIVITQITVGYGDLNVVTTLGKFYSFFIILVGVTYSALLLILFMRFMSQASQEEQSHFLLSSLQKKAKLTQARVHRIETQWQYAKRHCIPQSEPYYQQQIRKFRFRNRREIMLQRYQSNNLKRLLLSNFSNIVQLLLTLKQKQQILAKYIKVIQKAEKKEINQDEKTFKLSLARQRQQRLTKRMYSTIMCK